VLLVASANRLCYYSNKLQTRTTADANPPYVPVCLAVVGTNLRLEIFDAPTAATDNWNADVSTRNVPTYHNLGTVDPSSTTNDEYFQYFKPNSAADVKGTGTKHISGLAVDETKVLSDADVADVNSVLIRARLRLTGSTADRQRTRDIVYRMTLRATRYSAERCGLGNATAGIACS
jgi:hypothetical protein